MLRAELLDFAEAAIFHIFREQLVVRSGDNYSRRALYFNIFPVGNRHLHKSVGGSKKFAVPNFANDIRLPPSKKMINRTATNADITICLFLLIFPAKALSRFSSSFPYPKRQPQ